MVGWRRRSALGNGAKQLPPVTLFAHSVGNLDETSDVGTGDQGRNNTSLSVLLASLPTGLVTVDHDGLELGVDLLVSPLETLGVLGHFKTGNGNTTTVGSLTRGVEADTGVGSVLGRSSGLFEDLNGVKCTAHVGAFSNVSNTGLDEGPSLLLVKLILGSRRKSDIGVADKGPGPLAFVPLEFGASGEGSQALSLELDVGNVHDLLRGEALFPSGDESTCGIGEREDSATELNNFESSVLGYVTGTGDKDSLAFPVGVIEVTEHFSDVIDETVTSGLGTDVRTSPVSTLTGKDTSVLVPVLLIGTEHEANLTSTSTNVTSRDISVGTDVSREFLHEGIAESSDLAVGLALGVKVGTTLTTAHHETCESVLENLLETKELEDREVDGGMETETTLVRTKSRVELDSVTSVDGDGTVVTLPCNSELEDSLGDLNNVEGSSVLGVLGEERLKSLGDLGDGLLEFGLRGVVGHCG